MNKRHLIALAKALRAFRSHGEMDTLIDDIMTICAQSNPAFSRQKFLSAILD